MLSINKIWLYNFVDTNSKDNNTVYNVHTSIILVYCTYGVLQVNTVHLHIIF